MEEVGLLKEEMRRVLESYAYKADWWARRREGFGRDWESVELAEGARAYADKQAAIYVALAKNCTRVWARNGDGDLDSYGILGDFDALAV